MISNLSDLENLIKLEPDTPAKTKKLHLVVELRMEAKKLLERLEVSEKIEKHLNNRLESVGMENEQLRKIVGAKCGHA